MIAEEGEDGNRRAMRYDISHEAGGTLGLEGQTSSRKAGCDFSRPLIQSGRNAENSSGPDPRADGRQVVHLLEG